MCFPQVPGIDGSAFLTIQDVEFRDWAISAYNDWLTEEFQAASPKRLLAHGVLPLTEPAKAVAELQRIVKRGIKSLTLPYWIHESVPGAKPLVDPMYDPIWSACEDMGIPVNMHIGGGYQFPFAHVKLTIAHHGSSGPDGECLGSPTGVVLTMKGKKIYHAGDTDVFSDMKLIARIFEPRVSILPIGGHYTMGAEGAALAVEMLQPSEIIPKIGRAHV